MIHNLTDIPSDRDSTQSSESVSSDSFMNQTTTECRQEKKPSKLRRIWNGRPEDGRSFYNWLLCWLVLPNIGYWLLWFNDGCVPRPMPIIITGLVGLLVNRAPFILKFSIFILLMLYSVLEFIATLFFLEIRDVIKSIPFILELDLTASREYLISSVFIIVTLIIAWYLLRKSTRLSGVLRFAAVLSALILTFYIDRLLVASELVALPTSDTPFSSAVNSSGLERIITGERHLLIIMVESMGLPVDLKLRQQLLDMWIRPEVRLHYSIATGETPFYGGTTRGEMRELCGRWGDYPEVLDKADPTCLPARLAQRGYHTQAWNSFSGSFFDVAKWYPHIGFEELRFLPELSDGGAAICTGVFSGVCDRDVPTQIGAVLKQAHTPQFIYWLTVNSHLPIAESASLQTENCAQFNAQLNQKYPMICREMQIFAQTGRALAQVITAPDFPATDILIVGDHIPPFFDRRQRTQFVTGKVPWILLRHN